MASRGLVTDGALPKDHNPHTVGHCLIADASESYVLLSATLADDV